MRRKRWLMLFGLALCAFTMIGTATSAVAAGKIGWYQVNSTNNALDRTFLRINSDGDATIEMTIEIVGLKTITTADFVL